MAQSLKHLTNGLADRRITSNAFKRLPTLDDGPAAIVGGQLIDSAIERALRFEFRHLSKTSLDRLFDYPEPLSSLSSKIRIAQALKILDPIAFRDCDKINKIRNAFAHSLLEIDFSHPDIVAMVRSLEVIDWINSQELVSVVYEGLASIDRIPGIKGRFVETVRALFARIWILRQKPDTPERLIVTNDVVPLRD